MRKGRWSLKFKAGLYVGFFTIFFIITLMVAVGFGFDRYYYSMKKEAMVEASQKISNIYRKEGGSDESSLDDLIRGNWSIRPGQAGGSICLWKRI